MDIAKLSASMSYANRLKVGAVVVKNEKILSTSWNGTPKGWDNSCEIEIDGNVVTKPEVSHAEEMAISKMCKDGISSDGAEIFVTHSPCYNCAKIIFNSGIQVVYYNIPYRDTSGIEFLEKCGVVVIKVD